MENDTEIVDKQLHSHHEIVKLLKGEVRTASRQYFGYWVAHLISICIVVVAGAMTTYYATVEGQKETIAMLAIFTTIAGTFEKMFGLGKKKAGFRNAKVAFQNLLLECHGPSNQVPNDMIEKIKKARLFKNELTSGT